MALPQKAYFIKVKGTDKYIHYDTEVGDYFIRLGRIGAALWIGRRAANAFLKDCKNNEELELERKF